MNFLSVIYQPFDYSTSTQVIKREVLYFYLVSVGVCSVTTSVNIIFFSLQLLLQDRAACSCQNFQIYAQ